MNLEKYTIKKEYWQFENGRLTAMILGHMISGIHYEFNEDNVDITLFW